MGLPSFIAKLWRTVYRQESLKPERTATQLSSAWIRERVHVAIDEEALQSNSDEISRQCLLPSAPFSSPSSASVEPTVELPLGKPENGYTDMVRIFEVQEHEDLAPSLLVGWLSDPGIKRRYKPNEDSLFAVKGTRLSCAQPQTFGLFIVADGLGGHVYGQEASRLGIQTMIDWVLPLMCWNSELKDADFRQLLVDGVQAANQVIYQRNEEQRTEMGTTITAALIIGATAFVVNVGDSRTYLYRESVGLRKVTHDHSLVANLVESGIIKPDDIYSHPKRNQIYRSLGAKPVIEVDAFTGPLQPGDTLVLCSDGLWEMVRDPLIQQILWKGITPSQNSQALVKAALEGGGADNVSVIVVQITEARGYRGKIGLQLLAKPETVKMPNLAQRGPKLSSQ